MSEGATKVQACLVRLFQLKYVKRIIDGRALAHHLGVSAERLQELEKDLDAYLISKLGTINDDRLRFVCPECLSARLYEDPESGEVACTSCGYVLPEPVSVDSSLPFDLTYAFESDLAVGRSLGGTVPGKNGLYRVIAKNGKNDLGLRALQTRIITETMEHPVVACLLCSAFALSKRFNLDGDKLFNNDLGRNIRRAFWLTSQLALDITRKDLAETVFFTTLYQYEKYQVIVEARKVLSMDKSFLSLLVKLNHFLLTIRTKKEPLEFLEMALQAVPVHY